MRSMTATTTRLFSQIWQFMSYILAEYRAIGGQNSAAALTYMTLFAIVPLMTVSYAMFSIIPAFEAVGEQLQSLIFDHFVPRTGREVQQYLVAFSSQAHNLTAVGVAMLLITALLMLKNIERAFNNVWGVCEGRRGLSSFLIYWAVLSLGPLLLGIGFAMSTYLVSLRLFVSEYDTLGVVPWAFRFFPWVLMVAAFTLLFVAVPNCKVSVRHAAMGGVLTAVLLQWLKDLFSLMVTHSSVKVVYGAFAIVPLFLLWINLLWIIILVGAVFVRALSSYKAMVAQVGGVQRSYSNLVAALLSLSALREKQTAGGSIGIEQLLELGVGFEQWQEISTALLRHNVLTATQEGTYVLCRDLRTITLQQLADMISIPSQMTRELDGLQAFSWAGGLYSRLSSIDRHRERQFDITLDELFTVP